MMTLAQLHTQRNARCSGVLTVRAGDKWVTYKSDREEELARAVALLEPPPQKNVRL